jgi:FkbM family methyltransferase
LQANGFFIECGAFDGVTFSNTFFLERKLNWSGVLIEADPNNFVHALTKGRNVTLVPACLSLSTKPKLSKFVFGGGVFSKIDQESSTKSCKVQCLPLYSILLALNQTTVDLFSLDIEGNELDVLRTIPFDKINIKVHKKSKYCPKSTSNELILWVRAF